MLEDDDRETLYRDYTATMQKHLVNLLGSRWVEGWEPVPSFLDMLHPQQKKQEPPQQTAEEAKAHVYAIFGIDPEKMKERG